MGNNKKVSFKLKTKVGFWSIILVLAVSAKIVIDVENIQGYEAGVVYKWIGGLQEEYKKDGLRFVFFGTITPFNIGKQKVTFADEKGVKTRGRLDKGAENEFAPIELNCGLDGGQSAWIHVSLLYSVKKEYAVELRRKGISKTYRYVVLKRAITERVNQCGRVKEALEIYSGAGFNLLQDEISVALMADDALLYFNIHKVTIYQIRLIPDYEKKIEDKQLAKQMKFRAEEEAKAAVEEAKKAAAEAQIEVEQRRAAAEASKLEVVIAARAENQRRVLEAEAVKTVETLLGEGQKLMKTAQAVGIEAIGLAKAQVEDAKKRAMFDGIAGQRRAGVEIAKLMATTLDGLLAGTKIVPDSAFVAITGDTEKLPLVLNTNQGAGSQEAGSGN